MKKTQNRFILSICLAIFPLIVSIVNSLSELKFFDLWEINGNLGFFALSLDFILPSIFVIAATFVLIDKNKRRQFYFLALLNLALLLLIIFSFDLVMILFSGMEGYTKYYTSPNLSQIFFLIIRYGGAFFTFLTCVVVQFVRINLFS